MSITLDGTNGITSPGIIGVTDGSNATAGTVGEYISSVVTSGSQVSLTTLTAVNITSISLTAGDWDVSGSVWFDAGSASTVIVYARGGASSTSATMPSVVYTFGISNGAGGTLFSNTDGGQSIPTQRFNLSTTTTIYLVASCSFSVSTLFAYGFIRARRIR